MFGEACSTDVSQWLMNVVHTDTFYWNEVCIASFQNAQHKRKYSSLHYRRIHTKGKSAKILKCSQFRKTGPLNVNALSTVGYPPLTVQSFFFFFKFLLDTCPFVGPLIPLFGTSGDVSSGFQSQSGFCLIRTCGGIRNIRSLRFTSGATHLPVYNASIAASHLPHMRVSAVVGCRDLNR